jgi:hypothetical protein
MASQLTSSFLDPDPALLGPPTLTISGITNRTPVVDNPNIKLPSQTVKSLIATSAEEAIQQSSQSQNTQNTVSNIKETGGFVNDGLGTEWSPNKYSPTSIAGNAKYVDPKSGQISSTSNLDKGLNRISKSTNSPRIKTVKIPRPNSTKGAETLLNLPKTPTF